MTDCNTMTRGQFSGEPALEDLIADPIVQAVMRVDGLDEADLRRIVSQARQGLTEVPAHSREFTQDEANYRPSIGE